jgi:hypothetical protein
MCHRIREAMNPKKPEPLGGQNKVVEADETFIGGNAKNRAGVSSVEKTGVAQPHKRCCLFKK